MVPTSSRLLTPLVLVLALLVAPGAWAGVAFSAAAIRLPGVTLGQVHATVAPDLDGGLRLQFEAERASVPAMGWRRVGLNLDGVLRRDPHLRWILDGTVKLAGAPGGALADAQVNLQIDAAANTLLLDIRQGKAQATTAVPLDQPTHAQIQLDNLPFRWLQGLLSTVWSGRPTGGRLDAELAIDQRENGLQASGQFTLAGIGFDTPAGTLAGQGLGGSGRFGLDSADGPAHMSLDGTLRGGELLLGSLYAKLPQHAVQLSIDGIARGGAVTLDRLRINDPDALQLDGALAFNAKGDLQRLHVDRVQATLPAAYDRYGQAWLGTLGLHDMRSSGEFTASVDLRGDGLHAFSFRSAGMSLADADGRLAVGSLKGAVDWSVQGDRPATDLGWQSLQLYRLTNGAAQARLQSRGGLLALQQPMSMSLLGGSVRVSELGWRPAAARGERLSTTMAVSGIDMRAFSQAMGWPQFPGTLGGAISGLSVSGDRIDLHGGLALNVFGGFVDVTGLSMQQPFGEHPVLSADISLRQLDLAAITSVFDFGSITGLLDGSITGLRLVDWSPVAFDARMLAGNGGRISQRAVNNLTSVGGGGIAAGLQGAVLKLFKTFGYKRLGLNCKLQGSVCHMSGLEPTSDGYTIVDGSGLPHLEVIGHQTQVDWPTLVRRLKAATEGAAPEVR